MDEHEGQTTVLPCGCVLTTQTLGGIKTFLYAPCHLDCEYYLYAVEQSAKKSIPLAYKIV